MVTTSAYCETSKRAVFRLVDGALVSATLDGVVTQLGSAGSAGGMMACDKSDRIFVAVGTTLQIVQAGQTTTEKLPVDVRYIRTLDDGSVGLVDIKGNIYRYATSLQQTWTTGRPMFGQFELDGAGDQILAIAGTRVEITDRSGKRPGPVAVTAAWLDNKTVMFGDRSGLVGKWSTDADIEKLTKIELPAPLQRTTFIRTLFQRAGKRMIMYRNDGPIHVASFDAQGAAKTVMISRIPSGRRSMATGDAQSAIIAVNDRAIVVDLTRPAFAIDHDHPLAAVDAIAFSPDGRSLAMLGGDRDILIASLDGKPTRRLTTTAPFVRGPLLWLPDGTLIASTVGAGSLRWSFDGTVETRKERALGFTRSGGAITITRELKVVIDRGHSEHTFQITDKQFGVMRADVTDRYLVLRGTKRVDVFALYGAPGAAPLLRTKDRTFLREAVLVGDRNLMYLDDQGMLLWTDGKAVRELDRYISPAVAVSADRRRTAVAAVHEIHVYDTLGNVTARLQTRARTHAVAWSPDLRTLAVATRDGVELWTVPIDERL